MFSMLVSRIRSTASSVLNALCGVWTQPVPFGDHSPFIILFGPVIRWKRRLSISELLTTETELRAIAAAAIIGFSSPAAATGMAIEL